MLRIYLLIKVKNYLFKLYPNNDKYLKKNRKKKLNFNYFFL